jgi:hypothetical protein
MGIGVLAFGCRLRDADGGDLRQARRHWREALSLYTELGAPEAEEVRAKLAAGTPTRR